LQPLHLFFFQLQMSEGRVFAEVLPLSRSQRKMSYV